MTGIPLSSLKTLANVSGFRVSEVAASERSAWEATTAKQNIPLALSDLELWKDTGLGPGSTLCLIHDGHERLVGGFAVHHWPSRALPGHCILRLERLGESIPVGSEAATVEAVRVLANRTPRTLRAVFELHDRDLERRSRIASALRTADFQCRNQVRMYERTLAIDLQRDDKALLTSFAPQARQRLRLAEQYPLSIVAIEDDGLVPHLEKIHQETYSRTGGEAPAEDWSKIIDVARKSPERLRIFGVMLNEEQGPRLVAYARALRHGTFAEYDAAGSTRLADRRIPLMYPVIWSVIRWARDTGAVWLDLGGVTVGAAQNKDDPLAGISEFKRKFRGEEIVVGEDWQLDIAPLRLSLVRSANKALSYLRSNRI